MSGSYDEDVARLIAFAGSDEDLARQLLPHVRRIVTRVLATSDPDIAASAVTDATLAVCRHRHAFRGESKPSTWLYTIARRAALRCAARAARQRGPTISMEEPGVKDAAESISMGKAAFHCASEAQEALADAIPNRKQRELWLLWNAPRHGLPDAVVAELAGYALRSCPVILSKVRRRIATRGLDSDRPVWRKHREA